MDLRFDDRRVQDPAWVNTTTAELIKRFPEKITWFLENGYNPHFYQLWFHCSTDEKDNLTRWRSLVAGRRGGKTLCAAWEMAYYITHPDAWWRDAHGSENNEDAWWWFLAKDHTVGLAGRLEFRKVLKQIGMQNRKDYNENKQEKFFEFERGRIDFRSAEDPSSLVGAGLNGIWLDESAKIPNGDAWETVRPCLSDKQGIGIFTTTPEGKNWFYNLLHAEATYKYKDISRVEYRSLDNTYFKKEEWDSELERFHPLAFKREYMASFDAFSGRDLPGDWLHYYTWDDLPRVDGKPGQYALDYYIGVDPAISMADNADFFALSVIGVPRGSANRAFVIESISRHIKFAEQLDVISEYQAKYRPVYIGIEDVAYQRALVQQASRLDSSPNVIGVPAKGSKAERIISMSPAFRLGKCLIQQTNKSFIDEWLDYDTTNKNAQDDVLDSVEIALRIAGVISEDPPVYLGGQYATVKSPDQWIWDQQPKKLSEEERQNAFDQGAEYEYQYIADTSEDSWYWD